MIGIKKLCLYTLMAMLAFVYSSVCVETQAQATGEFYVINVSNIRYKGVWDANTTYASGDMVSWDGSTFLSRSGNNKGTPPNTSAAKWAVIAQRGDNGATGPQGPQGPAGPAVKTVAVCVPGGHDSGVHGDCSCSGRTVSKVYSTPGGTCSVTSDTGGCSAGSTLYYSGGVSTHAACCVCAPN